MQLSEEQIDAIIDSVATYGDNGGREYPPFAVARAVEAALRAQADARPVAWQETHADGEPIWDEGTFSEIEGQFNHERPLFTHPEASAPGLNEEDRRILMESSTELARHGYKQHAMAIASFLTRASAATVGEASGWKPAHELSQNHPLRVAERAAQQQAEPVSTDPYLERIKKRWREEQQAIPAASFEDPRVQTVYEILCRNDDAPVGEHWEGFQARIIVDALFGQQAEPGADKRESLRDKWKIVDGDCREGANGLITHHVTAFDEGWQARAAQSGQRAEYLQQIARAIEEDHPEQAYNLRLFIAGAAPTQQQEGGEDGNA